MNVLLTLAFLFFIGSVFGWVLEVFFRRFFSSQNPQRKWINPGFCVGPYLPLYGCGLCFLYLIACTEPYIFVKNPWVTRLLLFAVMAVCMTVIEYIAGIVSIRCFKVRLWDYSGQWGNLQGIICPKFSFFWAVLGAVYYFGVHPYILNALDWLSRNLAFSFFIGVFFGVFTIDVIYSTHLVATVKRFAEENQVIVRYERLKEHVRASAERARFFFPLSSNQSLSEHLKDAQEAFEKLKIRKKR